RGQAAGRGRRDRCSHRNLGARPSRVAVDLVLTPGWLLRGAPAPRCLYAAGRTMPREFRRPHLVTIRIASFATIRPGITHPTSRSRGNEMHSRGDISTHSTGAASGLV